MRTLDSRPVLAITAAGTLTILAPPQSSSRLLRFRWPWRVDIDVSTLWYPAVIVARWFNSRNYVGVRLEQYWIPPYQFTVYCFPIAFVIDVAALWYGFDDSSQSHGVLCVLSEWWWILSRKLNLVFSTTLNAFPRTSRLELSVKNLPVVSGKAQRYV